MMRIMVIEGDEGVRKLIREGLRDTADVIETGDPAEALGFALKSAPDAILLDLNLPGFSGLELCQTLCSISYTKNIPVFVMVGDTALNSRDACLKLGAREVFRRPPDFPTLNAALLAISGNQETKSLEEVQVQLKVILKLMGKTDTGKAFELLTATDQVSMNGFQCRCSVPVQKDSIVEVIHVHTEGERRVGRARVLAADWDGMPWQTCRFQFTEKSSPWIV